MHWEPISQANAVRLLEMATERTILDFKKTYDLVLPKTKCEIAKDVAAFANNLGGTILVGAIEGSGEREGRPQHFEHVTNTGALVKAVDSAIKLCRPIPVVIPEVVRLGTADQERLLGRKLGADPDLLAINVQPLLTTPIGAPVCDENGKLIDDAYRFPIRTIEGTRYLRPEELAFHMNSAERRSLIQLLQIDAEERKQVRVWSQPMGGGLKPPRKCELQAVEAETLTMTLSVTIMSRDHTALVPLAFVRAIWQSEGVWNISVEGTVFEQTPSMTYFGFLPPGSMYGPGA